jgi:predicted double-glycine peptidase
LDGDRVLYQKAQEMESTYRKKHGLDAVSDTESDDDFLEDERASRRSRRRTRFEEASEDSDSASDDSSPRDQSRKSHRKKISRRSSHDPNPLARGKVKYRRSTVEDDRIRKLEQELRDLKMGGKGRAKRHSRAT